MSGEPHLRRLWNWRIATAAILACAAVPAAAISETLGDAIALAYETSPLIRSQRAALRATDEEYAQAMAGYRPTLSVTGQAGHQYASLDQQNFLGGYTNSHEQADTGQVELSLVQPLYTGGAVRARVNGASADIMAGRENLRRADGQLLLQVITAYVDVRRDRQIIQVLDQAVADLNSDVTEAQAGSALGQTSRTDVALAEGRLLNARLQILQARAKLGVTQASYLDLVGQSPGALEPEPQLDNIPAAADEAFDIAEANNPQLRAAIETELAARAKIAEAKAADAPNLSVKLDGSIAPLAPYLPRQYDHSVTASIVYNQSFFTGGLHSSYVREAIERDNKAALDVEAARRDVVQAVSQAWEQFIAAKSSLSVEQDLVKTEMSALRGDQLEHRAGQRSELDILNTEAELASAQLSYLQSRHDAYVASAALINAMGLLNVRFVASDVAVYRPEASLDRLARKTAMPLDGVAGWLDSINAPPVPAPISASLSAGGHRPPSDDRAP